MCLCSFLASAIKCWRCSSDASNAAFCNDPFDASIISDQQRRWSYVECTYPPGQLNPYSNSANQRAVCKKVKQLGKFSFHFFFLFNDTLQIYLNWSQQMTCNARVPFILYWKSLAISFARLISSDKWFFVRQIFERVIHTWNHVGHRLCLNWAIIFIKISFIKVFALCPHPVWHAIAQQTQ